MCFLNQAEQEFLDSRLAAGEMDRSGTTVINAIVKPEGQIVVGNLGDSRALLIGRGTPIPLSTDHKPNRPDEKRRVESAGGQVRVQYFSCQSNCHVKHLSGAEGWSCT